MARFVTDLVRGPPPTALTVFFDGAAPRQAARRPPLRAACRRGPRVSDAVPLDWAP